MRDNLLYCGMGDGLMILEISDPATLTQVSRLRFPGEAITGVVWRDGRLHLSAWTTTYTSGSYRIVDVSDPAAPIVTGTYPIEAIARGVDIQDSLALVAVGESIGGFDALLILDIADTGNIVLLDSVPTDNGLIRVSVRGDHAYATGFGGLHTIDISDPSDATLRSQFSPDIDHLPLDLDLRENDSLIYIADLCSIFPAYVSAFSVYNVADPENPSLWGRYPLFGYVADVKIKDNYAFVSNGSCGVQVFDITDPTSPDSIGQYQTPSDWVNSVQSFAGRLAIQGDLLFFADIGPYVTDDTEAYKCYPTVPEPGDPSPGDLIILDISNPTEPTLVSHYTPDSLPTDVDDDTPGGLPASFALHQNYPNPFNPTTTVRFDLPRRSEIVLTVYNLLGQEVSRKVETRSAGHHTLELDLKDQPSGVYLYKLQANDFSETRKMLLLK
ncbi:MAG: T9SS type A sorting domain-containing protein, partial [bacterium]|nr:T9SS type A sorting domain-containing protein [bacterium]